MKENVKRIGSLLLAFCMIVILLPQARLDVVAASSQPSSYSTEYNSGQRGVICTTLDGTSASSYYTASYTYGSLSKLSASSLKSSLSSLMKSTHSYTSSYDDCHYKADRTDCQNGDGSVSLIYTSYSATMNQWNGWNREHVWPQSLGGDTTNGGGADLHHVRPSDAGVNSSRGNKKYGESGSNPTEKYGSKPAVGYLGGTYNSTYFEPLDNVKGDVARICLYVHVRWGSDWGAADITDVFESVDVLLAWCELDPVDTWEMGRNEVVQAIQGNRNVFIDYPEYAWLIFGEEIPDDMPTPSGMASGGSMGGSTGGAATEAPTESKTEKPTESPNETESNSTAQGGYTEATISFTSSAQRTEQSSTCQIWKNGNMTFTNNKGSSTTNVANYVNPVRLYAKSSILIECDGMTKVVFNCASSSYANALVSSLSGYANVTSSGSAVTVSFSDPVDELGFTCSAQIRMNSIVATCRLPEDTEIDSKTETETLTETETVTETETEKPTETESKTETETETEPSSPGASAEATLSFADTSARTDITVHGGANGKQVWSANGITLTNTNNVADYANPVRLYSGSTVNIACAGMTEIRFACASASYATTLGNSLAGISGITVSTNGSAVVAEFASPVDEIIFKCSAQIRLNSLTATYNLPDDSEGGDQTEDVIFKIKSAKLELSEDIGVIYTAIIPEGYTDHYMVFNFCGNDYTVYGSSNGDGTYSFKFDGVLPQCMGDNICATLYATYMGEKVSACVESYSVRQYCVNQLSKTDDARLVRLLSDLLYYGASAQKYRGYNTDSLVTNGLSLSPSTFTTLDASVNKKALSGTLDESARWKSAGLVYDNSMSMFVRLSATDVQNLQVRISISGREETFNVSDLEKDAQGNYVLYFRGILATEFDSTVTAVFLKNGVRIGQTMTYSVNSYIYSAQNSTDISLAELLKATYNYGASAYEYSKYN